QPALGRAAGERVLDAEAEEAFGPAVVHADRDADDERPLGHAQPLQHAGVEVDMLGHGRELAEGHLKGWGTLEQGNRYVRRLAVAGDWFEEPGGRLDGRGGHADSFAQGGEKPWEGDLPYSRAQSPGEDERNYGVLARRSRAAGYSIRPGVKFPAGTKREPGQPGPAAAYG